MCEWTGREEAGKQPYGKNLVGFVDEKLSISQKCVLVAKRGNLGNIRHSVTNHSKGRFILLYSALVQPHHESCVW